MFLSSLYLISFLFLLQRLFYAEQLLRLVGIDVYCAVGVAVFISLFGQREAQSLDLLDEILVCFGVEYGNLDVPCDGDIRRNALCQWQRSVLV